MLRQIVLFIVEGYSDQNSFENILNHLSTDKVKYKIIGEDITTKSGVYNIHTKINARIKDFLRDPKNKYSINDIKKIVHLVDIDGVFVRVDLIIEDKTINHVKYEHNKCYVKDKAQIIKRNLNKKKVLIELSKKNHVKIDGFCLPYECYYFSCNLEHVLHNDPNVLTEEEKVLLSNNFADKYLGYEEQFVEDLESSNYSSKTTYEGSWDDIINHTTSFIRLTNFNLFFKKDD